MSRCLSSLFLLYALPFVLGLATGCAGTGPSYPIEQHLAERNLGTNVPVVLVDLDDTLYEREVDRPLCGSPSSLQDLARDHLIVYLTARPTYAKIPWVTHNRDDSIEFLEKNGFPPGPLFTSSFWNWLYHGEGGGKVASCRQLREFGVGAVALAVGDRPHDLDAYLNNPHVAVEHVVVILIEDTDRVDRDRVDLPEQALANRLQGSGPAWPRILDAYRRGELRGQHSWTISQSLPTAD